MLRIQKSSDAGVRQSSDAGVTLSLSGRIEIGDVAELERALSLETASPEIAFDLQDIVLVDRDAVRFLVRCEAQRIQLRNCPAYIREWMVADKGRRDRQEQ